jgi:ParB family chromosome partitioning protein
MTKRALGRGLSALIGDAVAPQPVATDARPAAVMLGDREAVMLEVERLAPNPRQPRKSFEEEGLQELAASIRRNGVLQPVLVRRVGSGFQLIAGERRLRAAKLAGHGRIPALICTMEEAESLRAALLENIQREDLNAIEEAEAYKSLMETYGATHQELADMLGKNRSTITNTLRLLSLESSLQEMILDGSLMMGHARSLLALEDTAARVRLAREAAKEGLSVRALERLVQRTVSTPQIRPRAGRRGAPREPDHAAVRELERRLEHHLGAPVAIRRRGRRGRIEVQFFSDAELERLLEAMGISAQL